MKVLYVSRRFYPDVVGGGQISAYHMARAVKEQGVEVYVLTFTNSSFVVEDLEGVKVYRQPIFHVNIPILSHFLNLEGMYVQIAYHVWRFIDKLKPDVVHLLNMESVYLTSWIVKMKGVSCVETINSPWVCGVGTCIDYEKKLCNKCSAYKMFKCFIFSKKSSSIHYLTNFFRYIYKLLNMKELRFFEKEVDKFFPISRALRNLFILNGYDEKKIEVIPLIQPVKEKKETDLKKRLGIPENYKVILYIGRVIEEKGVHRVVDAMQYIDNAVLLIVGRGSYSKEKTAYYKSLEKKVSDSGLNNKVKFIGYVDPRNVGDYYSITDLTVHPCWWFEGFSRSILESCAYGIPVIATNIGGIPDVIEDGKNGILLNTPETMELVNAIKYVLNNPERYSKMAAYCKEKVSKCFSYETVGKMLVQEYSEVIEKYSKKCSKQYLP